MYTKMQLMKETPIWLNVIFHNKGLFLLTMYAFTISIYAGYEEIVLSFNKSADQVMGLMTQMNKEYVSGHMCAKRGEFPALSNDLLVELVYEEISNNEHTSLANDTQFHNLVMPEGYPPVGHADYFENCPPFHGGTQRYVYPQAYHNDPYKLYPDSKHAIVSFASNHLEFEYAKMLFTSLRNANTCPGIDLVLMVPNEFDREHRWCIGDQCIIESATQIGLLYQLDYLGVRIHR